MIKQSNATRRVNPAVDRNIPVLDQFISHSKMGGPAATPRKRNSICGKIGMSIEFPKVIISGIDPIAKITKPLCFVAKRYNTLLYHILIEQNVIQLLFKMAISCKKHTLKRPTYRSM
jgi:hypothetical protein